MTPVLDLLAHAASLNCGKDSRSAEGGHWTERSEGSGWSEAELRIARVCNANSGREMLCISRFFCEAKSHPNF